MSHRGVQPTSWIQTGRLQQEAKRSEGRILGRPWLENRPNQEEEEEDIRN
jgi:hypothetical protein